MSYMETDSLEDDKAIVGGIGKLEGRPVVIIGEEKGRGINEKVDRNFGMPKPEGYRKALRLMEMAERFRDPSYYTHRYTWRIPRN